MSNDRKYQRKLSAVLNAVDKVLDLTIDMLQSAASATTKDVCAATVSPSSSPAPVAVATAGPRVRSRATQPAINTENVAKAMRYWHRPMTTDKLWQVMQKRGYAPNSVETPPNTLAKALRKSSDFVSLPGGKFALAPSHSAN